MNMCANTTTVSQNQFSSKPPPTIFQNQARSSVEPVVRWTYSIADLCRNARLAEAVKQFTAMNLAGVEPNHVTLVTLISASETTLSLGASLHAFARKLGLDTADVAVGTALADMYAKRNRVDSARLVFDHIKDKNQVSWNTMIGGYMRNGRVDCALQVFDQIPRRDRISWTALIGGFVKWGRSEEALQVFRDMQIAGVEPDYVTVIAVLAACADLGTAGFGLWTNRFIVTKRRTFKNNVKIHNSLIDMYARCGCVEFARQVFEEMPERTVVSWNSIIVGFAVNGYVDEALEFFDQMQKEGFKPNGVSFTGALTACSHAGLVEKGLEFFEEMERVHKIKHRIEHYGCIVDLYSRAGRLEEALDVIKTMPIKPNEVILGSVLAACRALGDIALAEKLMKFLSELEPGISSNYILLANTYAAAGEWDEAGIVRKRMKALGIPKTPGLSSIEIDCDVHEFLSGDMSHADFERMCSTLKLLSSDLGASGYVPESVLGNSNE